MRNVSECIHSFYLFEISVGLINKTESVSQSARTLNVGVRRNPEETKFRGKLDENRRSTATTVSLSRRRRLRLLNRKQNTQ